MRRTFQFLTMVMILLLGVSCNNSDKDRQDAEVNTPTEVKQEKRETPDMMDASFTDGMTEKVWQNYLQVKNALVQSDSETVQSAASNLAESFDKEREQLKSIATNLANESDLEKQRELFFKLTGSVETLFKNGLSEGTIYKQYCPMAFNNTGATWFSDASQIRNPYFGDRMLKCGSIKEEISK